MHTSNTRRSWFRHFFTSTCHSSAFLVTIPEGVKWNLLVALICIFLNGADIRLLQTGVWVHKRLDWTQSSAYPDLGAIFDFSDSSCIDLGSWAGATFSDWEDARGKLGASVRLCLLLSSRPSLIHAPIIVVRWAGMLCMCTLLISPPGQKKDHNFKKKGGWWWIALGWRKRAFHAKIKNSEFSFPTPPQKAKRRWGMTGYAASM